MGSISGNIYIHGNYFTYKLIITAYAYGFIAGYNGLCQLSIFLILKLIVCKIRFPHSFILRFVIRIIIYKCNGLHTIYIPSLLPLGN